MTTFNQLPVGSTFDLLPDGDIRYEWPEWKYRRRVKLSQDLARDEHGLEYRMSPEREVFHVQGV